MSTMNQIRSYDHQLYNITINKLGLSPFDDKRYILDDGINSLADPRLSILTEILNIVYIIFLSYIPMFQSNITLAHTTCKH